MSDKKDKPEVKDLSPKKDAKGGAASSAQGVQNQGVHASGVNLNKGGQAQGLGKAQGTHQES